MTQRQARTGKQILRSLSELTFVLALWISLFTIPLAAAVRTALTAKQSQAVAALADYASAGGSHFGVLLAEVGYKPETPAFDAFPGIAQLESAYLAAEQASPGSGDLLIAALAKRTAVQYESARNDPTLKTYLALNTDEHQRFQFASPPSNPRPKPSVTKAIATLADYAEGNAIGGPQAVLRDYFGLSSEQVYDLLRQHETTKAAIIEGASWVPESERSRRFSALVADLDRAYDGSIQADRNLDEFRPKTDLRKAEAPVVLAGRRPEDKPPFSVHTPNSSHPPDGGTSTGTGTPPNSPTNPGTGAGPGHGPGFGPGSGPGSGSSSGPRHGPGQGPSPTRPGPDLGSPSLGITPSSMADEQAGLQHYREFLPEHYSVPAGSMSQSISEGMGQGIGQGIVQGVFDAVVEGAGGFGGIVFGNDVSAAPGLGKPRSLTWIPEDSSEPLQRGRILLSFEQTFNGTPQEARRSYGPVLLEDAYAAYRIVFAPNGMPEWSKGQAVGLMGLYDKQSYLACDANDSPKRSDYWRILLNPGLFNSELGQSAVYVDSLPIVQGSFRAMLKSGASDEVKDEVDNWLDETPGTWKFIDRPMIIGSIGQRITVVPVAGNRMTTNTARFIDVRSFDGDSASSGEDPFSLGFQKLFPVVVSSSHEFSRINGFAPVLALFRWAKTTGASVEGFIPSPTKMATPEAILIGTDDSISPTSDMSPKQVREQVRANIDACLADLSKEFSAQEQSILRDEQTVLRHAALDSEPALTASEQRGLLLSRMEYIENVARSIARRRPDGQPVLRALTLAEQNSDDSGDDLPQVRLKLIQGFYSDGLSNYKHLQEQADAQAKEIEQQTGKVADELKSALDDRALAAKLMAAVGGDAATHYASLEAAENEAEQASKKLEEQVQELIEKLSADQDSCVQNLPLQLHRRYAALQTRDARFEFIQEHCTGWAAKAKQGEQLVEERSKREKEAEKANDDKAALLQATLPKFDLWRKVCISYLPESLLRSE